eukprot:TRINITY_DN4622_c0_g1_i2.p1 TRINITY_DN4622_c0_g1~~TRINITY_DN4622_c0_g1_i2.p1  ORF type:complete len:194 (+),score=8.83 TRINITY_DN4622_c0_g1_i2:44-625(+)
MESDHSGRKPNVLIGLSGSVATIKAELLTEKCGKFAEVKIVTTHNAMHFFKENELSLHAPVYKDEDEWNSWGKRTDPVVHIELRKWADIFVIAPLSANTLAKLANGLCDNLLTSVARAWDYERPFIVAPAMNTMMWTNPHTAKHLRALEELGIDVIPPISKTLVCGDSGIGAMTEVDAIVAHVERACKFWVPL